MLLDDGSRKYVWGLGLAYAVPSSGEVEVYHTDGLGSVRAITDASGTVVQTYQTDEFGIPTQTSGSSTQPFQYTGEQRDGETGFVYLRARMYDPAIGRFLQRDPLAGSLIKPGSQNRYSYVGNNPCRWTDPSGLKIRQAICGLEPKVPSITPAQWSDPGWAVSIPGNINAARDNGMIARFPNSPGVYAWFYEMVKPGGPWDYKSRLPGGDPILEHFGNWHYGVVGRAAGIEPEVLLALAGAVQAARNVQEFVQWALSIGTREPRYVPSDWRSLGDDPVDQMWIRQGIAWHDWYQCMRQF